MNIRVLQKKDKRVWNDTEYIDRDNEYIFKSLSSELISKYIYRANWIKRIEINEYYSSEHKQIIVTYDNGYRSIYLLER